ncbi:hypothetical protein CAPN001_13310 [Capnocytophaga stomatis]|uniref:hypothetical protein n=1 Tax=Capnocytophaga stomatis TaxID=1848904 RepID=UPI00194F71D3|nr:hypothetical protein [Capnocytophaga stomatis]GIJ96762.1 hypothetical protein CAPN001_13310 [Capnocytophaga stomatis]
MNKTYYFHLFLANISEDELKKYNTYTLDEEDKNPPFFKELKINDYAFGKYGMDYLSELGYDVSSICGNKICK